MYLFSVRAFWFEGDQQQYRYLQQFHNPRFMYPLASQILLSGIHLLYSWLYG